MLLRPCVRNFHNLPSRQLVHFSQRPHLTEQSILLAEGNDNHAAVRDLMRPFHRHLISGRTELLCDPWDDWIDGSSGKAVRGARAVYTVIWIPSKWQ